MIYRLSRDDPDFVAAHNDIIMQAGGYKLAGSREYEAARENNLIPVILDGEPWKIDPTFTFEPEADGQGNSHNSLPADAAREKEERELNEWIAEGNPCDVVEYVAAKTVAGYQKQYGNTGNGPSLKR